MKRSLITIVSITASVCISLVSASVFSEESSKSKDMVNATLVKPAPSISKKTEADSIKLESVFVGDKEQPAISYFIPWQGIGTPDKLHWNVEQKHDGALDLVDREIMLRSMHIYDEMNLETPQQLD